MTYELHNLSSVHDVDEHSRGILRVFLESDDDYLLFFDSDLVILPGWRETLRRLLREGDTDIVSLYDSAFHRGRTGGSFLRRKQTIGNAGSVMSRDFAKDLSEHSSGSFDWDYVKKRGRKGFVVPTESVVDHFGHFGTWNHDCSRSKVEHARRFDVSKLSAWVKHRFNLFTVHCLDSEDTTMPVWFTVVTGAGDPRRLRNAKKISAMTSGDLVDSMSDRECRVFLGNLGDLGVTVHARWPVHLGETPPVTQETGTNEFLAGKIRHWCSVLRWFRTCVGRRGSCVLIQDDTLLRPEDIPKIIKVAEAPLIAPLTTMTTACTECVMITDSEHAGDLLRSVTTAGLYGPTDWQLLDRVHAMGIGKRHAGWPSVIRNSKKVTWDEFGRGGAVRVVAAERNLTVYVLTRRDAFKRRALIRSTWAKGHDVVFMVGRACDIPPSKRRKWTCELKLGLASDRSWREKAIDKRIDSESDVVRLPMVDVYRALPRKVQASLGWLLKHRPGSKWFHKADDDMFVNVDALKKLVGTHDERENIVLGSIQTGWKVGRQPGKWQELKYKPKTWPPFPLGSAGHTVTRGVAEYVQGMTEMYQGEDVCMGIWLKGVARFVHSDKYRNDRKCPAEAVSVGHDLTDSDIERCAGIMEMGWDTKLTSKPTHNRYYAKPMTANSVSLLWKLMRRFVQLMDNHGIQWCLAYGTMFGAVCAADILPWDDEIDVFIFGKSNWLLLDTIDPGSDFYFKGDFEVYGDKNKKFYHKDGLKHPSRGGRDVAWTSPFIDIRRIDLGLSAFIADPISKSFTTKDMLPLTYTQFGDMMLPIPSCPECILKKRYKADPCSVCKYNTWDHIFEKPVHRCTAAERHAKVANCYISEKFRTDGVRCDKVITCPDGFIDGRCCAQRVVLDFPKISQQRRATFLREGGVSLDVHNQQICKQLKSIEAAQVTRTSETHGRDLNIIFWNAERGKTWEKAAMHEKFQNADIILLNEMDVGMARSGNVNTARLLAEKLDMNYVQGIEFVELTNGTPDEIKLTDGQTNSDGFHTNAILSKLPLLNPQILRFKHANMYYSNSPTSEIRLGNRMALYAKVIISGHATWLVVTHIDGTDGEIHAIRKLINSFDEDDSVVFVGDLHRNLHSMQQKLKSLDFSANDQCNHLPTWGYRHHDGKVKAFGNDHTHLFGLRGIRSDSVKLSPPEGIDGSLLSDSAILSTTLKAERL